MRQKAGYRSAREAAIENGWPESSYGAHERGSRTIGQDDAERYAKRFKLAGVPATARGILFGDDDSEIQPSSGTSAKIVGFIGAGALVEPEYEQVPGDGLGTIDLPFSIPDEIVAFKVKGESMRPVYRDGDAVLVWADQRHATDSFVGEEAAVRTGDGRRYIKEIQRGQKRGLYNLYSHNDNLIENVRLAWIGEIYLIVRASQLRKMEQQMRAARTRSDRRRAREAEGTEELPLHPPS